MGFLPPRQAETLNTLTSGKNRQIIQCGKLHLPLPALTSGCTDCRLLVPGNGQLGNGLLNDYTNSKQVHVFDLFLAGMIFGPDTSCAGDQAEIIISALDPEGGNTLTSINGRIPRPEANGLMWRVLPAKTLSPIPWRTLHGTGGWTYPPRVAAVNQPKKCYASYTPCHPGLQ